MNTREELYFKNDTEWRAWLEEHHDTSSGVYLIFYKVSSATESMRWEEAVKVALCFGWIDSTVKKLDEERRRQYFCPRNPKSVWSKLNKSYIVELIAAEKMHESGSLKMIAAMKDGSWTALDDVENGVIPKELQTAFEANPTAFENYQNFSPSYRKSYLYWLNQAKRATTREKRIAEIIRLCAANIKSRNTR
ncbi:bacteriocin-protection, YdeI or OmpD-Associated [Kordia sp. SMS9]|uniref:YdeI/OmpD-associated family protein n=1 Tax=Kordia sp. SMS9 TaxID=2282170 RepID=UPI000E0D67CA|nr:YdeI/OmpD-associated family protein [Kordia sp. SMS9]AXG70523.1 bacteriocin-protection, YdeI or OmpD-Associated [Kordia sp. SMS9]